MLCSSLPVVCAREQAPKWDLSHRAHNSRQCPRGRKSADLIHFVTEQRTDRQLMAVSVLVDANELMGKEADSAQLRSLTRSG